MIRLGTWLALALLLTSCVRLPIKSVEQAMRKTESFPSLNDDLGISSLIQGLEADIMMLRTKTDSELMFGPRKVAREDYIRAMEFLVAQAKLDSNGDRFKAALRENFEAYEIYGRKKWGEVFMTSYYEPIIRGSMKPKGELSRGLYATPKDLVDVELGSFVATRPALAPLRNVVLEQRSQSSILRGRLLPNSEGRQPRVVAYPDRAEISSSGMLDSQGIALAYVDPIDGFLLEIQGSGIVKFEDGSELSVGYAAQNGHPYVAIGRNLLHVIPKEKMSIQAIEAHLRALPKPEAQKIMNTNPSYVFFQKLKRTGVTYFGAELVTGRSIATDQYYFPKGTLAFLEFDRPVFNSTTDIEPASWQRTSRFVLDQDTGGAIRGADRLDLFWGRGDEAKQSAGVIKNTGRLVYFVPKPELLARLNASSSR